MDNVEDLSVLLKSRHGLILAETDDEERFLDVVNAVSDELSLPVWVWTATKGLSRVDHDPQYMTVRPSRALDFIDHLGSDGVYVFADAHSIMNDAATLRRVKELGQSLSERQALILTAPKHEIPPELDGLAHKWRLRPPDRGELEFLVKRTVRDLKARNLAVHLGQDDIGRIADAVQGLSLRQAERLIQRAALEDGQLTEGDVAGIRDGRAQVLLDSEVLELVETRAFSLDDVGGFTNLKSWLSLRRRAFTSPIPGLDPPRGLLMTGIPGCGKSLAAKAVAASWELPLVLLEPARLYSKYLGESEQRLLQALDTVDVLAPAVLWIDEIEKGFSTGSSDGGVSTRVLGTFLRWMQERSGSVFLIATANDVSSLPPELLRKGRFDEIFFVDLPDEPSRAAIFSLQLARRELDLSRFDVEHLARLTAGCSGAEIEMAIVGGLYRAHAGEAPLSQSDIEIEIASTVPLSVTRAEDVARLRSWAASRAVIA